MDSFNRMTTDLRASHTELERRRAYTETLLRNVRAGVVGLDPQGIVTAINPYAERILGLNGARGARARIGAPRSSPRWCMRWRNCSPSIADRTRPAPRSSSQPPGGGEIELMVTASALGDEADGELGTVLFLEDVSQIAKVERMEAWREVARRIAHEIKNPLTPIQLSAERLRRQLATRSDGDAKLVDECTRTIIGEVEDLKRLVNEFSAFARMPHLNPTPGDLNRAGRGDGREFSRRQSRRRIRARAGARAAADRDRPRRAQARAGQSARERGNAVGANHNGARPRIDVRTAIDAQSGVVTLEVRDNGPGIDPRCARGFSSLTFPPQRAAPASAWRLFRRSSPTITASSGCATTGRAEVDSCSSFR